jgi:2-succinyl-6-hydroxy-2,4-cyclohexadiene-1-carboxylate synthase
MSRVVCLHGFTGSPESFEPVREHLPGVQLSALRLVGHGEPARAVNGFEDEVARLAALLPKGPLRLVGYSLGARLALGLLTRHQGRFESAVLIGLNPGLRSETEREQRRAQDQVWIDLLEKQGLEPFLELWERQPLFAAPSTLPLNVSEKKRSERRKHDPFELARSLRVTGLAGMPDYWPFLPELRLPVTLMAGEKDEKFRNLGLMAAELLPHARVELAGGASHDVLLERPDLVAVAIEEQLEEKQRHD